MRIATYGLVAALALGAPLATAQPAAQQGAPPAAAAAAAPPLNPDYARRAALFGTEVAAVEPFRIVGNIYYVGTANIASYLITTPKGHFLIDTGPSLMAGLVATSIIKLGFKLSDVKVLLPTHAHVDHVQSFGYMQRATGASIMAMAADVPALESGKDLSSIGIEGWEPMKVDRVLRDNDEVTVGGVTVRAIWAPGHTQGNTTWITTVQDGGRAYVVAFGGPPTPIVGNPKFDTREEDATTSFRRLREYKVDMQLPGHPQSAFAGKLDAMRAGARPHPLLMAPGAWTKLLDDAEGNYRRRLEASRQVAAN